MPHRPSPTIIVSLVMRVAGARQLTESTGRKGCSKSRTGARSSPETEIERFVRCIHRTLPASTLMNLSTCLFIHSFATFQNLIGCERHRRQSIAFHCGYRLLVKKFSVNSSSSCCNICSCCFSLKHLARRFEYPAAAAAAAASTSVAVVRCFGLLFPSRL